MMPAFIKAIIAKSAGQQPIVDRQMDIIQQLARDHADLAKAMNQSHTDDKKNLYPLLNTALANNRSALQDMVAPVGRSVTSIEQFSETDEPIVVDEAIADSIRSSANTSVGEKESLVGRFLAVDTVTGACKFQAHGAEKPVRCKITDPVLTAPDNIYTHALNSHSDVTIEAKPLLKDGAVSRLYISNANSSASLESVNLKLRVADGPQALQEEDY
jgi:hypothetical protein